MDTSSTTIQSQWRIGSLPPSYSLWIVAVFLGIVSGGAAALLKFIIGHVYHYVVRDYHQAGANWTLLFIPLLGILLTVAFQKLVIKRNIEHGSEQVARYVAQQDFNIPLTYTYGPIIASSLTLGFGGSAGAEGPIATCCAAMGSRLARWLKMPPEMCRILIGCGAGAGIAGIFKAPIGGVMFTLEVMGMNLSTIPVIALVIACVLAGMTSYGLTAFQLDVPLTHPQYFDPHLSGWVIVLGVFCGLYSIWYSWVGIKIRDVFERIPSIWIRGLISGLILSGSVFLFPSLYGEGYNVIAQLIDGNLDVVAYYSIFNDGEANTVWHIVLICGGIALIKSLACVSSNSGGGVAGDFAPTLFAGCMAGFFFAGTLNHWFGLSLPAENFALIAMAGAMAGIIRAPLMSIFIVTEMTGYYGMLFPVMIAAIVSYAVVTWLTPGERKLFKVNWKMS